MTHYNSLTVNDGGHPAGTATEALLVLPLILFLIEMWRLTRKHVWYDVHSFT
jgi:hypothetical protein